jgi:hypothetical protein
MRDRMRSGFTYSNVMATVAVFIALGGSAYAALKITGKEIVDSSVTTRDIRDKSLLKKDFRPGQLSTRGPQGIQGPQGEPGAPGGDGALAYAFVNSNATLGAASRVKNFDRAAGRGGVPEPAFYCLHTTVVPHNVVATVNPEVPSGFATVEFYEDVDGAHCPDRTEAFNIIVRTWTARDTGTSLDEHPFTIAVN